MRLLALTYGTEGDTRPLAALCHGLIAAGHAATLLADGGTLDSARALGVPHAALEGDIRQDIGDLVAGGKGAGAAARGLAGLARRHITPWMRQTNAAAQGCDAILAGGLAAFVGMSVAERHGLPLIGTGMIPLTPTHAFPSPFLPPGRIAGWLGRASYGLVNGLIWRQFRGPINRARQQVLGLPPRRSLWTGLPMLYGISPSLLPRPDDWPADHRVCGQWRMPEADWAPPADLRAFLDAGPPPVYLGFGSMTGFDRETMLPTLLAALAPRRVLLFPGWAGLPDAPLPDNVFVIGPAPHEALFPRCALAIHHGGSGTSHSACRAGVPSLVMPFAGDQFFWADRLRRLGVAPPALSPKRLDGPTLAKAIAFAESAQARASAAALGRSMAAEDGVATAVAAIEALLARR